MSIRPRGRPRSTDTAVLVDGSIAPVKERRAKSYGLSSSASESRMRWGRKSKRSGDSNLGEQGGDGGGRDGYREPDMGMSFPDMSESWDLDSLRERRQCEH